MTRNTLKCRSRLLALALGTFTLLTLPSFAQVTVNLAAVPASTTMPDGAVVAMWGYVTDTNPAGPCPAPAAWQVGPTITATAGASLTINVRNCLDQPTSVFIPGQYKALAPVKFTPTGDTRARVRSFDAQTPVSGTLGYSWPNLKAGTYLYHSGTHAQVQVQMGLYGALVVNAAGGEAYPGHSFTQEKTLLYSEIDPALHAAVAGNTYGTAAYPSTFNYIPKYYLINGLPHPTTPPIAATSGQLLLRLINAGLKNHVPTLGGGLYMSQIAEDGYLYPGAPRLEYSVDLAPAKTVDAVVDLPASGRFAVYDRAPFLTQAGRTGPGILAGGMLAFVEVGPPPAGAPTAVDDAYDIAAATVAVPAPGVLANDTDPNGDPLSAAVVTGPSAGTLQLNADGSFTYTRAGGGVFTFTYQAFDTSALASNVATVTLNVIAPVAVDDVATTAMNTSVTLKVLGNDTYATGTINPSTVVVVDAPSMGGTVQVRTDGTIWFTPRRNFRGTDVFTYTVAGTDGAVSNTATVQIEVTGERTPPPRR